MKKLIVVADWAADSLTNQEVRSAVEGFAKNGSEVKTTFVASTPSTIHTAFLIKQILTTEERYGDPMNLVIFQNTDPRVQADEAVQQAKGAEFILVKTTSGAWLCGPNAGYDFSMIRDHIEKVFHYPGLDKGSQFRSRDLYSRVCAHLMDEMEDELDLEEEHSNIIPGLQGLFVAHIDNYGNIKTTLSHEDMKGKYELGTELSVTINGVTKKAKYVSNLFGGTPGELVIYPGSSGNPNNPFMEVSVWRHFTEKNPTTGKHEFNMPRPGQAVALK